MVLSPILILALLFSSYNDGGKDASAKATATVSGTSITDCTIETSEKVANYAAIESAEISNISYTAEGVTGEIIQPHSQRILALCSAGRSLQMTSPSSRHSHLLR